MFWLCYIFLQSFSFLFLSPVDTTFPEQADYYDVIKHPMDLSTIKVRCIHCEQYWPYSRVLNETPSHSCRVLLAIRDLTVLPATRHQ